jgi:hypothetical protein
VRGELTGAPGALAEVVSVRFGDAELRRIQAFAVIYQTTPAAVIREACGSYLSHQVGTPGYHQAVDAYCERARQVAAALEPERTP